MNKRRWTIDEVNFLVENYKKLPKKELSKILNRTINAISAQASLLNLSKFENIRRNLTNKELKEIALKFKSKSELQMKDNSAYITLRTRGIIDEACSHMIPQQYSIPQLICKYIFNNIVGEECEYNTKKIITPYELDIYYPNYKLAIEYNGKRWHSDKFNDNTLLKHKLCNGLDITLIIIKENNRKYNEDIKNQIVLYLPKINEILNSNLTETYIRNIEVDNTIFNHLLDDNNIFSITKKYKKFSNFRKKEPNLYSKLRKINMLDKYTKHMEKKQSWDIDKAKIELSKYNNIDEFKYGSYLCFRYLQRKDLMKIIYEFYEMDKE